LSGTINLPDEKKRARGQTTRTARVVQADWERRYSAAALEGMTIWPADAFPREQTSRKKDSPDHTNSGLGLALAGKIARRGGNEDEFRAAVDDHPEVAGSTWASDERQVHRAWVKAVADFAAEKIEGHLWSIATLTQSVPG